MAFSFRYMIPISTRGQSYQEKPLFRECKTNTTLPLAVSLAFGLDMAFLSREGIYLV